MVGGGKGVSTSIYTSSFQQCFQLPKAPESGEKKKTPIKTNTHHAVSLLIPNPYHSPAGGNTIISQMKISSLENIQWLPRAEK